MHVKKVKSKATMRRLKLGRLSMRSRENSTRTFCRIIGTSLKWLPKPFPKVRGSKR